MSEETNDTQEGMAVATAEQEKEILDVKDAMYEALVGITRNPNLALSSVCVLLCDLLMIACGEDKAKALSDFRTIGIPLIELTLKSGRDEGVKH